MSSKPPTPSDVAKRAARAIARAQRRTLDPIACGHALTNHVLRDVALPPGAAVAGFWPLHDEIDIRPLLHALQARGHPVALPATPARGQPLTFHRWRPGEALIQERFGTMRPTGDVLVPDLLLIPLLAFDAAGGRLGYGGGFYDRTLARLPGRPRIGCAFAAQQVDEVPVGPYDIPLDAVATESGIIRCRSINADSVSG